MLGETICRASPRRRGGQHLKKNELEKKGKSNKNTTACKQSRVNQGKNNKGKLTGRPKPKAPSRWRQQFVVRVV